MKKREVRAIRKVLGIQQQEFASMLGVSNAHLSRTEKNRDYGYEVSDKLDQLIKDKLKSINIDVEEILEIGRKRGYIHD
ncbi:helix-turn-helix domain-containing protein [Rossellomorea marisflavi]